jgi:hypothetical protein
MGHCGPTDGEGDCAAGKRGSWNTTTHRITDLDACAARCARCDACTYVSFSRFHEDCSWYADCRLDRLSMRWAGWTYRSRRARDGARKKPHGGRHGGRGRRGRADGREQT